MFIAMYTRRTLPFPFVLLRIYLRSREPVGDVPVDAGEIGSRQLESCIEIVIMRGPGTHGGFWVQVYVVDWHS